MIRDTIGKMAPGFETLSDHDYNEELDEEIDFSDLRAQYDVRMEQGLDTFCVGDMLNEEGSICLRASRLSTAFLWSMRNKKINSSNSC